MTFLSSCSSLLRDCFGSTVDKHLLQGTSRESCSGFQLMCVW